MQFHFLHSHQLQRFPAYLVDYCPEQFPLYQQRLLHHHRHHKHKAQGLGQYQPHHYFLDLGLRLECCLMRKKYLHVKNHHLNHRLLLQLLRH